MMRRNTVLALACACVSAQGSAQEALKQAEGTLAVMRRVADWQLANPSKHNPLDWTHGALYAGYMALDGIQADARYRDAVFAVGARAKWDNGRRVYHADDYCVAQSYAEIHLLYRDPDIIAPTQRQLDLILSAPLDVHVGEIRHGAKAGEDGKDRTLMRWWWCDALFMAPPVWAKLYDITDDTKYLDFMIREWKATSEFLYDKEEHLYFRDKTYFPDKKTEANGKKIFWGRGNGWVVGGLVRVLQALPGDHPERPFFAEQFRQMCRKLIAIQPEDGAWRASLLDPGSYPNPEASSTGFITYGLAWGVNQGLLTPEEAEPALRRAWARLCSFVAPDGKLTHVQPIGADPKTFPADATEVYGVGAFLLAGSEIYRMDLLRARPHTAITVKSPCDVFIPQYPVSLDWDDVLEKLPDAKPETLAVMDGTETRWLTTQFVKDTTFGTNHGDDDDPLSGLVFQTGLHARQARTFILVSGMDTNALPKPVLRTAVRFVPERLDDFAWENDRTAYRAYGPALWAVDGEKPGKPAATGSGIDVWGKNDRLPIIDRMYKEKNYHAPDLGYGIDCYKVGTGPGCGGVAVFADGKFIQPITFDKWKILATGPVLSVFQLDYAPIDVGGKQVAISRRFYIFLGFDFYMVRSVCDTPDVTLACGMSYRPVDASSVAKGPGWIACWEPAQDNLPMFNGVALVGMALSIGDWKSDELVIQGDTAWLKPNNNKGRFSPVTHYVGSCWSGGKDYKTAAEWFAAVERFRKQMCDMDEPEIRWE